jgi:excisionase family DNA binding protein
MFNIEVRLTVNGRTVLVQEFQDAILCDLTRRVGAELPRPTSALQIRPIVTSPEERKAEEAKPLVVSVNQAARLLGVSPRTIQNYTALGRIRVVRIGKRVLIPMKVLEKALAEGLKRRDS